MVMVNRRGGPLNMRDKKTKKGGRKSPFQLDAERTTSEPMAADNAATNGDTGASDEHSALVGELFHTHNPSLLSFVRKQMYTKSSLWDASDVTQQVYVRALQSNATNVKYWPAMLFKTAINLLRDDGRRRKTMNEALPRLLPTMSPQEDLNERYAVALQNCELLNQVLDEFPEKYRLTFTLRMLQHRSTNDVKKMLGVSERAVRHRIAQVLARLRLRIAESEQQ